MCRGAGDLPCIPYDRPDPGPLDVKDELKLSSYLDCSHWSTQISISTLTSEGLTTGKALKIHILAIPKCCSKWIFLKLPIYLTTPKHFFLLSFFQVYDTYLAVNFENNMCSHYSYLAFSRNITIYRRIHFKFWGLGPLT